MITVEKDIDAEEIVIHATPEDLREFAKKLWAISEKADAKGKHKELLTAKGMEPELSLKLQGEPRIFRVVKQLTISCRTE